MGAGDSNTIGTKRINTCQSSLVGDHLPDSKRTRRSSSTGAATNIDDLPREDVLGEILGRLPSYEYIAKCKRVSKNWCSVMSDPSFIRRFLCLQGDSKQTRMTGTLISEERLEFLARMSSSSKPLTPLFKRIMDFHHLKQEPEVVATYTDLVLCCATLNNRRDCYHYICNPYTLKWVPLPPSPQVAGHNAVGFLCDLPYYSCEKNDVVGHDIQLNTDEYKCRVVRIISQRDEIKIPSREFKLQIFSSETRVWRESVVSSPSMFKLEDIDFTSTSYAHNGMLHWTSQSGNFIIGLDPFMVVDGDRYECVYTEFDGSDGLMLQDLDVYNGRLQTGDTGGYDDVIYLWELNEQVQIGAGKSYLETRRRVLPLDPDMVPDDHLLDSVGFDPNNDGTLYLFLSDGEDRIWRHFHVQHLYWQLFHGS